MTKELGEEVSPDEAREMLGTGQARSIDLRSAEEIAGEGTDADVVPHKVMPGNRPTTSILATKLTPSVVGQLIALYEHQVFTEGVIWGIDSFDQWGVELGKTQANALLPVLTADTAPVTQTDSSTDALVRRYRAERGRSA